ncbi:hypothetical protein [Rhabdothermincola salaria]|uniref:hypothetical protein n=1 Tax=Rhabdothermincola salaria TaxID=2903142 RepID=UPI001E62A50B|nr:hypothetical protein [Rhabdothermincola salaria]MCD9624527.1 hypothetical protein [Rhabdothermincola salaria]
MDDASTEPDEAYRRLPGVGPYAPRLGGALITWVEPMPEHVVGYNRWYEDDHMITGAMAMPWMFSCRRWVAPRWLQHLRGPSGSRVAVPLEAGKYIGIYWINEGRIDDHQQWSLGTNNRLHADGRGSYRGAGHDPTEERRHVFTAFHDYLGPVYRDDDVPRDVHALVQPYGGLVVEVIDAVGGDRPALDRWLAEEHLPTVVGGPVALSTRFGPRPLPPDKLGHVAELEGVEHVVAVLHFLDVDPRECWEEHFADSEARIAAGGVGALAVQAAFVPTKHGTDAYTDELF